jgi:PAS domain S-box-containing protein
VTPQVEIESLRNRLFEAEELCRALSNGEVDAVVVGPDDDSKRVLLMSGAYARYRQIVEKMDQGAVTLSGSGEILFANAAFAALFDVPLTKLFRTRLSEHLSPEHVDRLDALLAGNERHAIVRIREDGQPVRLSLVSASDDFNTVLVSQIGHAEAEEAEQTLDAIRRGAVDAFMMDGERVVLLENAQAPYRALVERMHDGAVTVDERGEIAYANEGFLSLVGTPLANVLGEQLARFVPVSYETALRGLLEARDTSHADMLLGRQNGDIVTVQVTMTRLDGHKLLLFRDTSLQKRHQASDERNRRFLGMLAHEFRNILGPIGYAVAYLKKVEGLDPECRKTVDVIERQTGRLTSLVEDLRRINSPE